MKDNFEISCKTGKGTVCGLPTEIAVTEFSNKYFILITDCGKIGSLVQVQWETSESDNFCSSRVFFGKDQPEIQAVTCAVTEKCKLVKPVVFGLSLKNYTAASVKDVTALLTEIIGQSKSESASQLPCYTG
ncbi:proteasome assembly chaperone 3 [Caerostris extrusa]|uniref:Proteasome assembly chaperone 3 n=1 Tax=Caerostris extrusa TaxID=172846 RepID=A0AAV4S5F8_CAEEX|nr:proteasome assembly chaperone 3 [Caerostris extrusa]